jgi:hypothetical protein
VLPEAAVAVATVEHHNMPCAAAAAAAVMAVVLLRVKGALEFVEGRKMAESAGVEPRGTVGACRSG